MESKKVITEDQMMDLADQLKKDAEAKGISEDEVTEAVLQSTPELFDIVRKKLNLN